MRRIGPGAVNLSTFRATAGEREALDRWLEKFGIGTRSHFFRIMTERFIEQCEKGEQPAWPPRWKTRTSTKGLKEPEGNLTFREPDRYWNGERMVPIEGK
jgi:hypothetical protein